MLKVGTFEQTLEIPEFAELYGYGPFAGRRNLGVHDPLYCRAVSFNDGTKRALIIYTDTCTSNTSYCREMRARLSAKYRLDPEGIAFVATHTHSAPLLAPYGASVAWGEPHPEFQEIWFRAVMKVAGEALCHEEEIARVTAGSASLEKPLGKNRIDPEKNVTDPAIRWMKFCRADGSVKLLLHNHGIHGVCMNGPQGKYVSADWMGAANRLIKERKLAEMPLFMLGPCGDINTYTSNTERKADDTADFIGEQYVRDLEKGLSQGGTEIKDFTVSYALKDYEFPSVVMNVEQLKAEAEAWTKFAHTHENPMAVEFYMNFVNRINEMIVLLKKGRDLRSFHDLHVIKLGPASFFFIPGEYFVGPGMQLLKDAGAQFPFIATVSDGGGAYFPSEEIMKKFPDIGALRSDKPIWGFYEIYGYMHALRFKYQDHIAGFIASNLLKLEKSI